MSDPYVPTLKLRFVERADDNAVAAIYGGTGRRRVLQQWWEPAYIKDYGRPLAGMPEGEWRDVPLESE